VPEIIPIGVARGAHKSLLAIESWHLLGGWQQPASARKLDKSGSFRQPTNCISWVGLRRASSGRLETAFRRSDR
jgi:hypothetical protein